MDGAAGTQGHALNALLAAAAAAPERHGFCLFLRRVEAARQGHPRLGESARPAEDALRIGQDPSAGFAPRSLARVVPGGAGAPARLQTFHFGLFGPNGPLPLHLTDHAHGRRLNSRDGSFAAFADMLQHRMATLFYRAWAEADPAVASDSDGGGRFARQLAALSGYGMASLEDRDAMPDLAKLHFTGLLAAGPRHPEGLAALAAGCFGVPVEVAEFIPSRVALPDELRCRLGGETATLGEGGALGARARVVHHRIRLSLGPLDLASYLRFLPGAPAQGRLEALMRNYLGDALDWELNLVLAAPEVPPLQLGRQGRLGLTAWCGPRRDPAPARDLMLCKASRRAPGTADGSPPDQGERP
ncbi:type VI secretion system baseplate subunit TssG [Poseidonocella sp. HB161398]|uniref:type VI secretion system baseplate subunit TssG n=1 Tax=Poseidonocella sp. HB161398 TaxID=2320855 RepID=UPI001107EFB5|nr:type VI secretion system baseplate subunit TssG [Poseidonocella sp. HB161398]